MSKKTTIKLEGVVENGNLKTEIIKKKNAEIIHLKAKLSKQFDEKCLFCKGRYKYSEKYDSYYCPKCLYWLDRICCDRECIYCKKRPKYPVDARAVQPNVRE